MQTRAQCWQQNWKHFAYDHQQVTATLAFLYRTTINALPMRPNEVELWSTFFGRDYNRMSRHVIIGQLGYFAGDKIDRTIQRVEHLANHPAELLEIAARRIL